jgi:hypothetical protein
LAAVELLIGHQRWLSRDDFMRRFVRLVPDLPGDSMLAVVAWRSAVRGLDSGRLPCSDSEGHVLRIAAGIAEGVPADLRECLSTLDRVYIGLVADAVLRANGRVRAGGPSRANSGRFGPGEARRARCG